MRIAIVDDEPLALSRLERMLKTLGYTRIETFLDLTQSLQSFLDARFDVVFLDINMPQDGIEVASLLRMHSPQTAIIFQTAYKDYAFDAFELDANDYLLKPFTLEQLTKSLEKVTVKRSNTLQFLCKNKTDYTMVKADEILYIKADLNEVQLRTNEGLFYYPQKISALELQLLEHSFIKIHRSLLINTRHIHTIETGEQSTLIFHFKDISQTIRSSKEGAKIFRQTYEVTK